MTLPYGNNARIPVQKYRDLLKLWNAMMDEKAINVILGAELQDKVHYGMPVKDGLYDMLGYSKRIAEIKRSYREDANEEGEITVDKCANRWKDECRRKKLLGRYKACS